LTALIGAIGCISCNENEGNGVNTNPPVYIKKIAAYTEGNDGIEVYFVLADENGEMTAADGVLSMHIYEDPGEIIDLLHTDVRMVSPSKSSGEIEITFTPIGGTELTATESCYF
jgi:hypothetical protein